jgi:hypothetical protein
MTNWSRTTAELVAEIRSGLAALGVEVTAQERWEGDGVWQIWVKEGTQGASSRSVHVGGTDTSCSPGHGGAHLSAGMGWEPYACPTVGHAVAWLAGTTEEPVSL